MVVSRCYGHHRYTINQFSRETEETVAKIDATAQMFGKEIAAKRLSSIEIESDTVRANQII